MPFGAAAFLENDTTIEINLCWKAILHCCGVG